MIPSLYLDKVQSNLGVMDSQGLLVPRISILHPRGLLHEFVENNQNYDIM